ncbi:hypothetical protein [Sinorhizobium terangae]|uniref:hypothetical protein n=1 Tax=Sinorhizobium terangae TaxID=110322 RepID=UPI0024B25A18|nr:hypothetical protein [Sinorhizobium terangae]WFU50494.1 hypothetical protein QA637_27450 [Sinorhizobium terangae]
MVVHAVVALDEQTAAAATATVIPEELASMFKSITNVASFSLQSMKINPILSSKTAFGVGAGNLLAGTKSKNLSQLLTSVPLSASARDQLSKSLSQLATSPALTASARDTILALQKQIGAGNAKAVTNAYSKF